MDCYYRIRIDDKDVFQDAIIQALEPLQKLCMVRHVLPHGNPHYHIYVKNNVKEQTLRQRFKRLYPHLQPSDISIKNCNPERIDEYVQYLFNTKHGNISTLIEVRNIPEETITLLQAKAKEVSDEYASSKKRTKQITMWDLAQEIHELVNANPLTVNDLSNPRFEDQLAAQRDTVRNYITSAITVCRKHHKGFDEFMIRKLITTAMSHNEDHRKKLIDRISYFYLKE